jgi:hypothetical protein
MLECSSPDVNVSRRRQQQRRRRRRRRRMQDLPLSARLKSQEKRTKKES